MKRNQLGSATERKRQWHVESKFLKFRISIPSVSHIGRTLSRDVTDLECVPRSIGNELTGTGHRTDVTKPELSSSASTGSDIFTSVSIVTQTNHTTVYTLNDDRIIRTGEIRCAYAILKFRPVKVFRECSVEGCSYCGV